MNQFRKIALSTAILSIGWTSIQAQQSVSPVVSSAAPADASVAYTRAWTGFHNPAALSGSKEITAQLGYENRFGIKELSIGAASVAIPTSKVDIGVAVSRFGYSKYNETQAGIALSRRFTKRLQLAVQANYYSIYLSPEEGSKGTVVAQIGLLSELTDNLTVGFHAFNPAQTNIGLGDTEKRIPSLFELGAQYKFGGNLLWLAQIDKEIDHDLQWRTGFEYWIVKEFAVRVGGYGSPFVPNLGASLQLNKFALDLNFERHQQLGINSACALRYAF
ncbi:MAG: hypothetical protein LBR81_02190 [Prevotellaceae bacterium]|nr:hypothetical protein [Prevotellaceae bacterium]